MALFLSRLIMAIFGILYTGIGAYMAVHGLLNEFSNRTFLPMLIIMGDIPPAFFEEDADDERFEHNYYVPFVITGVFLTVIGISFLANIP